MKRLGKTLLSALALGVILCGCEDTPDWTDLQNYLRQQSDAEYARMRNQQKLTVQTYLSEMEALKQEEQRLREEQKRLEEQARLARETLNDSARAEKERADQRTALRAFALKESPRMWAAVQELRGELNDMESRLDELFDALSHTEHHSPENDAAYLKLLKERRLRAQKLRDLEIQIVAAYMASKKFETAQNAELQSETDARVQRDGFQTAEELQAVFRSLATEK